jgi:DNA gyrase/topoisomerase IV subunit B
MPEIIAEPEWEKLSPFRQVRLRTEYVFGSRDPHTQQVLNYNGQPHIVETTWIPALFTAVREILDNALDEVITHNHGNRIDITYDPATMVISVTDNGRGMPIEWNEEHQKHAATVLLSDMFAGRNFKQDRGETRGLNGIGAKGVNYCSEWFQVEVYRNKQHFEQRFQEGEELMIEDPIIFPTTTRKSGTTIRFKLSRKVFPDMRLPEDFVASRIHEIALCYPQLHITLNGKRIQIKDQTKALFGDRKPIIFEIDENGFKGRFWLVPDFMAEGEFAYSLVNGIPLFNGGTHIDAFRRGFFNGLLLALERESKRRKLVPNKADVSEGMLLYNIMEMTAPSFDSQSKTRLINENVGNIIRKTLDNPEFFKGIIKKYPEWIERIYERCDERTKVRDGADARKQAKRNLRQKIEDLEDACGYDRTQCILFLAEGKSAVSGITEAGNKEIHGSLPLRGKVMNVFDKSAKDILANEALSKIMNSIGLIPGERVNRGMLRYGKVYIATDADEDGKNIAALLVNFFYTCWPDLFDPERKPFVHIFNTPLIVVAKGKQRKYWYSDTYYDFNPDKYKGWEINRAKGLAGLKKDDWKHILANPQIVPITDDGDLKETLSLLFNSDRADDRKTFIGL